MPIISVITPASRGVKELSVLFRDFKNQTLPKNQWEHIVVYDGKVPENVQQLADQYKKLYNLRFCSVEKDMGDMHRAPGTKPRNHGLSLASGTYVCFCDDDDRVKNTYLEIHINGMHEKALSVVQMTCSEKRMVKNGSPDRWKLIPEIGLPYFPIICHVGTPCVMMPRKWALEDPWRYEPEHDFRFIKRIVDKHKPEIHLKHGMLVDVDGLVTRGIKDFVSIPPFYRD
jgi:glycosyltransferase involved in cell wall biosynthesis